MFSWWVLFNNNIAMSSSHLILCRVFFYFLTLNHFNFWIECSFLLGSMYFFFAFSHTVLQPVLSNYNLQYIEVLIEIVQNLIRYLSSISSISLFYFVHFSCFPFTKILWMDFNLLLLFAFLVIRHWFLFSNCSRKFWMHFELVTICLVLVLYHFTTNMKDL